MPANDSQCTRKRVPQVGDTHDFTILNQPERGVGNKPVAHSNAMRLIGQLLHQCRERVTRVPEREWNTNSLPQFGNIAAIAGFIVHVRLNQLHRSRRPPCYSLAQEFNSTPDSTGQEPCFPMTWGIGASAGTTFDCRRSSPRKRLLSNEQ